MLKVKTKLHKRNSAQKFTLSLVSLLACGFGQSAFSAINIGFPKPLIDYRASVLSGFDVSPRVTLWGETGNKTSAAGQLLAPIYGRGDHILFGIVETNSKVFNKGNWTGEAGLGLGYRRIFAGRILGGHLTTNYSKAGSSFSYLTMNPGMEVMANDWDVSVNGFLALRKSKNTVVTTKFAEDFGIYDYIKYTGHLETDRYATRSDTEAAGTGVEVRVGHVVPFFPRVKAYLGGYYFNVPGVGTVRGGLAKVAYEVNRYISLELTDTADSRRHNRATAGVKVSFGGYSAAEREDMGIVTRMLDPIERGYDVTMVPIVTKAGMPEIIMGAGEGISHDNLQWFNVKDASPGRGSGTFEDPYKQFIPENIQEINAYKGAVDKFPLLYIRPGEYSFSALANKKLLVGYGWGIYGRGLDPTRSAVGDGRAILRGILGFESIAGVSNSGNNYVDSVILYNTNLATAKANSDEHGLVRLESSSNVTLHNVKVGGNNAADGFSTAIWMKSSSLNLLDTEVNAWSDATQGGSFPVYGIRAMESSAVNFAGIGNNVVNVWANAQGSTLPISAYGVSADNSNITFNSSGGNNEVSVLLSGTPAGGGEKSSYGIYAVNGSAITFSGQGVGENKIAATTKDAVNDAATGIYALQSTVNLNSGNNAVSAYASGYSGSAKAAGNAATAVYGIKAENSTVNLTAVGNNTVTANANAQDNTAATSAYGIKADGSNVTLTSAGGNNEIRAVLGGVPQSTNGKLSYGIYANTSTLTFNGNWQGGANRVFATVDGAANNFAAGIYALQSTVNLNGGVNTVFAASNGQAAAGAPTEVYGIKAESSNIGFAGIGSNSIAATANAQDSAASTSAYGLSADNSTITFSSIGGNNEISALVEGTSQGVNDKRAYGVRATNSSTVTLGGQSSMITADTKGGGNNFATGVDATLGSGVTFYSGGNTVSAHIGSAGNYRLSNVSRVYGIRADNHASVNFLGSSSNRINALADIPVTVYGIDAENYSNVNFSNLGGSSSNTIDARINAQSQSSPISVSAYGIRAVSNSSVKSTSFGAITIKALAEVANAEKHVYGIYADTSTMEFSGSGVTVEADALGGGKNYATGLFAIGSLTPASTISFSGGNTAITASATGGGDNFATGLSVIGNATTKSQVSFSGGSIITATASGSGNSSAVGLDANYAKVIFGGGDNAIGASANGAYLVSNLLYGIRAINSEVIFDEALNGGNNTVKVNAIAPVTNNIYGIFASNSTVTFSTSGNNLIDVSLDAKSIAVDDIKAYGINMIGSIVKFSAGGTNKVKTEVENINSTVRDYGIGVVGTGNTLDFSGANNIIEADISGGGATSAAYPTGLVMFSGPGGGGNALTFAGNTTITAKGTTGGGNYATGLFNEGILSTIIFNGATTIEADANGGITQNVTGLYAKNLPSGSLVTFNSDATIKAVASGSGNNIATGLHAENTVAVTPITFGGISVITANATGGGVGGSAFGLQVIGSATTNNPVSFSGGSTITATASGSGNSSAVGLDASYATVSFGGGNNAITASANGAYSAGNYLYGIRESNNSKITFVGVGNIITVNAYTPAADAVYGVDVRNGSSIIFPTAVAGGNNEINVTADATGSSHMVTAYGLALDNATINFVHAGGNNAINVVVKGAITADIQKRAYGIYEKNSTVNFSGTEGAGGKNIVTATSKDNGDNTAIGIYALASKVLLNSGENHISATVANLTYDADNLNVKGCFGIFGSGLYSTDPLEGSRIELAGGNNTVLSSVSTATDVKLLAYGLYLDYNNVAPSLVYFLNGVNNVGVTAKTDATNSTKEITSAGVFAGYANVAGGSNTVAFINGDNSVTASSVSSAVTGTPILSGYGISVDKATLFLSGGTNNKISASVNKNSATGSAAAYGLYSSGGVLILNGGTNTVSATTNNDGAAYGIKIDGTGRLHLSTGQTTSINVANSGIGNYVGTGISIGASGVLTLNGTDQTNLSNLLTYVSSITHGATGTLIVPSYLAFWDSHGSPILWP